MPLPSTVTLVEVGARDGLQNEAHVSTESKISLLNQLTAAGLKRVEAGAFVSPKWVPQMADSKDVINSIARHPDVEVSALTPNLKGAEIALACGVDEFAIFTAASEAFTQKNINCSIEQSIERFRDVVEIAQKNNVKVRGYVSCVVGCPYQGNVEPEAVLDVCKQLLALGCYEISLGDTIGVGTPKQVESLLTLLLKHIPTERLAIHFHDTYGQALANIYTALQMGISTIDSAVAGLGGCPYAQGASGNVATEDVIYLLQGLGIDTGIDLEMLAKAGWEICDTLNKQPTSKVSLALRSRCQSNQ